MAASIWLRVMDYRYAARAVTSARSSGERQKAHHFVAHFVAQKGNTRCFWLPLVSAKLLLNRKGQGARNPCKHWPLVRNSLRLKVGCPTRIRTWTKGSKDLCATFTPSDNPRTKVPRACLVAT